LVHYRRAFKKKTQNFDQPGFNLGAPELIQYLSGNVGYRKPPEYKFPAAYDDCLAAALWTRRNIDRSGGDRTRLALAGDSSGGVTWQQRFPLNSGTLAPATGVCNSGSLSIDPGVPVVEL
jgi:hypothetical protein